MGTRSGISLTSQVLLEVVHRFPSLGHDRAIGFERICGDYVFQAPVLLPGGPHCLDPCLKELVSFVRVKREGSLQDHVGHVHL
jgi:hypothetical protein